MMTTIRDVAMAAGVSRATAARVLSNPELVAEKARLRVLEVVQRLGYSRNSVAASLRTTRTGRIIVTVPDISNPFFSHVIRSEEHTSELQSLMRISYAVFCLKKKTTTKSTITHTNQITKPHNNHKTNNN